MSTDQLPAILLATLWREFIRRRIEDYGYSRIEATEQALDHFHKLDLLESMREHGVV